MQTKYCKKFSRRHNLVYYPYCSLIYPPHYNNTPEWSHHVYKTICLICKFLLTKAFQNVNIFKVWAAQTSPQSSYLPNPPAMSKFVFKSPTYWQWSCIPAIKSHLVPWSMSGRPTPLLQPTCSSKDNAVCKQQYFFQTNIHWVIANACL